MSWIITAFEGAAAWLGAEAVGAGVAALTATEVMAPIVVSASAAAAAGLTAGELAALGIGVAGAAGAAGAFDSAGNWVDPGYPGDGQPYDANGMPYGNTSSYEFGMPISDAQVAAMTQQQGASLGLQDAGWTWKDGVGWARNALGLANAAAGLFGTIQNGKYKVNANNAAANSSRLSAEDAARRATQIETYGLDAAKTMQPWDESGGRKLAGDQLQELMRNPMGVASNDPAYKFRQQAAQRAMGIYGQDSGAMGVAAADASSTWYDQRLQQLSGLAGANAAPGAGGALGVSSLNSAANIAGMGQASGAFGQQAGLAAQNAQTTGALNTLGAVGNAVTAVGNVFGSGGGTSPIFGSGAPIPGDTTYTPPGATSPTNKGPAVGTTGGPLPDTGGLPPPDVPPPDVPTPGVPDYMYPGSAQSYPMRQQAIMSQVGGYTSLPTPDSAQQGDFTQMPGVWQGQMGDLLGNYLSSPGARSGTIRPGA